MLNTSWIDAQSGVRTCPSTSFPCSVVPLYLQTVLPSPALEYRILILLRSRQPTRQPLRSLLLYCVVCPITNHCPRRRRIMPQPCPSINLPPVKISRFINVYQRPLTATFQSAKRRRPFARRGRLLSNAASGLLHYQKQDHCKANTSTARRPKSTVYPHYLKFSNDYMRT